MDSESPGFLTFHKQKFPAFRIPQNFVDSEIQIVLHGEKLSFVRENILSNTMTQLKGV